MRHRSLNVTVTVRMICRVPGPRPGRERPPLICPSGAAVSGPDLSAPYLREEDPPAVVAGGRLVTCWGPGRSGGGTAVSAAR